jgi:rhodanese-related sulfurtransferase
MVKTKLIFISILLSFLTIGHVYAGSRNSISGSIVGGYRIIEIQETSQEIHLKVYRGDYLKFEIRDGISDPVLSIPTLSIKKTLKGDIEDAPYFKMKKVGVYPFSIGKIKGDITVIEYRQANYKEVSAKEASELIKNIQPLILDVRTRGEYRKGHLENSLLIPLQELQARWKEISEYKNQDILIYCATGNRSTVASKILIDNGFKRIYNMRYGISDWGREKYPIKK